MYVHYVYKDERQTQKTTDAPFIVAKDVKMQS